jgi:hypothetical protein
VAVADHQPPATLVPLGRVGGQVGVDLGLHGGGQHRPGTLAHQLVQVQAQLTHGLLGGDDTQHAAFLPRRHWPRRRFQDLSSGKARRAPISRPDPQLQVIPLGGAAGWSTRQRLARRAAARRAERPTRVLMAHHPEADSFTADRLAGVVAGKTSAARPRASS